MASYPELRIAVAGASNAFFVDSTPFPGTSGAPVITKPEVAAIEGARAHNKVELIGIIASYIPYIDSPVSTQTGRPRVTFEENSGLAIVFTVDCITQAVEEAEKQLPRLVAALSRAQVT